MVDASDSKSDGEIHKGSSPFLGTIFIYKGGICMLTLELTEDELKAMKYNKEAITNLLVSRAIYNESYNYNFSETELRDLKYLEKNELIHFYMHKTVEPRVIVTENAIIDKYNENKEFFEKSKIPFSKAHDIIKNELNNEVNYGLEQDLVSSLVHNMEDTVTLKKEDIVFTKGDPNLIKTMLLFELLDKEAKKSDFYNKNANDIDILKKEVRLKFFVNVICSKDIVINEEKVSRYYVDNTKDFENMDMQEAYNRISSYLFQKELNEKTAKYLEDIKEKYNLDAEVKKYVDDGAVAN
jgi:hypothetical protein